MSKKNGTTPKRAITKKTAKQKPATLKKSPLHNNSAQAQQKRIAAHLRKYGRINTVYARDELGIMSPAPRIKELRNQGYKIKTLRISVADSLGVTHHGVADYVLISEPQRSAKNA
ncbi:MAG: hypothetical protein RL497_2067 [Pseudomonadota bacterium]|jgi:hypothetical protein